MITRIDRDIEQRNRLKEYRALLAQKYLSKSWEQWQHETSHSIKLWAFPLWLQGYTVGHWQPAVGDIKGVPINVDPSIAWRHRFIQLMPTHEFNLLPADIDRPDSHDHIIRLCEAGELTFPNYITINRETGHAQCGLGTSASSSQTDQVQKVSSVAEGIRRVSPCPNGDLAITRSRHVFQRQGHHEKPDAQRTARPFSQHGRNLTH